MTAQPVDGSAGIDIGTLTADVIHAARAGGLTPGAMGSAVQWTMLTKALLNAGWTPGVVPTSAPATAGPSE